MELGNLFFGNSRGEYPIPRVVGWEKEIYRLLDFFDGEVVEFENDVFWLMPYYWGECTCGWDYLDHGHQRANALEHRPDCFHITYKRLNVQAHGDHDLFLELLKPEYEKQGWDTESEDWWHGCAIKCTCDFDERYSAIIKEYAKEFGHMGHKPNCLLVRDNFHYKPTGFGIQWYKYPFRDSYMNQNISLDEFAQIIDSCIESLNDKLNNNFQND